MTKSRQTYNRTNCVSPARITDDGLIEVARCTAMPKTGTTIFRKAREEDSILSNIPLETNFFYNIIKFTPDQDLEFSEKGLGELGKDDGRVFLKREHVFTRYDTDQRKEHDATLTEPQDLPLKGWFILSTYIPLQTSQLLATEHSVVCSIDKFTPSTVPLEEATLLGRLDGRIQSIDSDELKFILGDNIKGALEETQGSIKLSATELSLKGRNSIIMTDQVRLNPKKQRPRRFSVGSLYYNEKKKAFEFHDGEKWRTLVAE